MKNSLIILILLAFGANSYAQSLDPYILASVSKQEINDVTPVIKASLEENGFIIAGEYMPVNDPSRWVVVVSHNELIKAVQQVGGLTGFAATLRVAATEEEGVVNISYTNPLYWGNAYFRDDFDKVAANYDKLAAAFTKALESVGKFDGTPFGSEKGVEVDKLRKYHYMFGMPYFDDTKELGEFDDQQTALDIIDGNLEAGKPGVTLVYKFQVPNTQLTLYGLALSGETGEENFMPKIDITAPKHTAFLPYEILVTSGDVHMLHGRFRIAVSFPDLTMGTFTKIMSTPGDIEDLLKQLTESLASAN